MTQKLITFIIICLVGQLVYADLFEFNRWVMSYSKTYGSDEETSDRYRIWTENTEFIREKNMLNNNYQLKMNEYGDYTWQEFKKTKMGLIPNGSGQSDGMVDYDQKISQNVNLNLPLYVNWTAAGMVTRVKNQYDCGSCWAFSTTGVVESMHAIKTGKLVSLSEENLIDCSSDYGNDACAGGLPSAALKYIIANGGIDTEASYPLTSIFFLDCVMEGMCPCSFNSSTIGATVKGYNTVKSGNETELQNIIAFVGPVSIGIDATESFQFYASGVFRDKNCSSDINSLNHAVLAVGYGTTIDGQEYYIVKNSWGMDWGLMGYVLMARNKNNMCGIATEAVYPY